MLGWGGVQLVKSFSSGLYVYFFTRFRMFIHLSLSSQSQSTCRITDLSATLLSTVLQRGWQRIHPTIWRVSFYDTRTDWDKTELSESAAYRSNLHVCRSVSLIAPLVSGVAGLSASSSSKADTLNIWCRPKNWRMWQLLETITGTINTLFPVVNFLKCIVSCYRNRLVFNCCF